MMKDELIGQTNSASTIDTKFKSTDIDIKFRYTNMEFQI